MAIFLTSDTHYLHRRILEFCPARGFDNIDDMGEAMIKRWNSVVGHNDLVYHLGDFAFQVGSRMKDHQNTVRRLNGTVVVVRGNHDDPSKLREMGFEYIVNEAYVTIDGTKVWMHHFPLVSHDDREQYKRPEAQLPWDLACFGHTHCEKGQEVYRVDGVMKGLNVGVDAHDSTPWAWEEIRELIDANS